MAASIVTHNGRRCRVVYKTLTPAKIRTGYQVWSHDARDWVTVTDIERADRWSTDYNITTTDGDDSLTERFWSGQQVRTRRYVPLAGQPSLVDLPAPGQRNAGNVLPLLKPGQTITVRPTRGQRYKLVIDASHWGDTVSSGPESSLITFYAVQLNMRGRKRWFRKTGHAPRFQVLFLNQIESIEEPTDGAQ